MNSKIYLAKNIKLDKNYKAVLNYSESDMLSLITDQNNLVYTESNAQFIRDTKSIIVKGKYNVCIQANYMAFSNPDYSNKWFFAFIDEVIYKGENNTEIKYTIDIFSTWYDYWTPKACFVVREHVLSDEYGEHTIPENLETGEYITGYSVDFDDIGESHVVMATTISPFDGTTAVTGGVYGGIYSGVKYYVFQQITDLNNALNIIAANGNSDSIVSLFYCPDWITGYDSATFTDGIAVVPQTTGVTKESGISIPLTPNVIDDYTPKNKKLFTYPYVGYLVSNNSGNNMLYRLEDFYRDSETTTGSFDLYGTCTSGGSIRLIPKYYKVKDTTFNLTNNNEYGLTAGKYPVASWGNDSYTNWLTEQGVNIGGLKLDAYQFNLLKGFLSFSPGKILGAVQENYKHEFNPIESTGNINSGDVTYSMDKLTYSGYFLTIKKEYAIIIDKFFSRMGYKVNSIKIPNMSNRQNYNYVQVANEENVAYPNNYNNICLPAIALNEINNLFRNGITIWNNHANFGDYSVSNDIVTPTP